MSTINSSSHRPTMADSTEKSVVPGHLRYCRDKTVTTFEHGCFSTADYVPAFGSVVIDGNSATAPPVANAVAWQGDPGDPVYVVFDAIDMDRDAGIAMCFHAREARLLADQLIAAADLVDSISPVDIARLADVAE